MHIRNVEGKDIFIPNSFLIKTTFINYTRDGLLRSNFMLGIAPECDINVVRNLILDYFSREKTILKTPKPNVLVLELGEYTTDLQVLFWTNLLAKKSLPDNYLGHTIRSKVISDIKKIMDDNQIEMPSQVLEHKIYRDNTFSFEETKKKP